MIASLKSALADALSLVRLLREAAARVKASEARAEAAEATAKLADERFRELSILHCRELAAHQADVRQLRRERDDEERQAIEAMRQRDHALQERDAARSSLRTVLADIEEAQRIAGAAPQDEPQEMARELVAQRRVSDELRAALRDARREAERLSAELRAAKSNGGGRS